MLLLIQFTNIAQYIFALHVYSEHHEWNKVQGAPLHLYCDARSAPPRIAAVLCEKGQPTQWADMQPSEKVLSCFRKGGDKQIMSLELLSIALGKFITFLQLHIATPFCFCGRVVGIFRRASEQERGDIFRQYWSGRRHAQGVFVSPLLIRLSYSFAFTLVGSG